MAKNEKSEDCCDPNQKDNYTCKVESLISIDERGQMVLPKEIRDKAHIRAGDKLIVISWEKDGEICCINLIKAGDLAEMVKDMLSPMMNEMK